MIAGIAANKPTLFSMSPPVQRGPNTYLRKSAHLNRSMRSLRLGDRTPKTLGSATYVLDLEPSRTVAQAVLLDSRLVEEAQQQIRDRRAIRELEMTPALDLAGSSTGDQNRQRSMIVFVGIAHKIGRAHV